MLPRRAVVLVAALVAAVAADESSAPTRLPTPVPSPLPTPLPTPLAAASKKKKRASGAPLAAVIAVVAVGAFVAVALLGWMHYAHWKRLDVGLWGHQDSGARPPGHGVALIFAPDAAPAAPPQKALEVAVLPASEDADDAGAAECTLSDFACGNFFDGDAAAACPPVFGAGGDA